MGLWAHYFVVHTAFRRFFAKLQTMVDSRSGDIVILGSKASMVRNAEKS